MKKVIIVEDVADFVEWWKTVILEKYPECIVDTFSTATEAVSAINTNGNFDVLILDGNLNRKTHGIDVLNILSQDQIKKTVICSADIDFIKEAQKRGAVVQLDKNPFGVDYDKMDEYILDTLQKVCR